MKSLLLALSALLLIVSKIGTFICSIWAIVVFILHIAKEIPFDWRSVYYLAACIAGSVVFWILTVVFGIASEQEKRKDFRKNF